MDIQCPHCGEPWDAAELHDMHGPGMPFARDVSIGKKWKRFRALGCNAWEDTSSPCDRAACVSPAQLEGLQLVLALSDHPDDYSTDCRLAMLTMEDVE